MDGDAADRNRAAEALSVVLTTLPDFDAAEALVQALLDERLIACGNLVPGVHSIYRWEGKLAREAEVLVLLKTTTASAGLVIDRLLELHPYDVPEAVEVEAGRVAAAYRDWVIGSLKVSE